MWRGKAGKREGKTKTQSTCEKYYGVRKRKGERQGKKGTEGEWGVRIIRSGEISRRSPASTR